MTLFPKKSLNDYLNGYYSLGETEINQDVIGDSTTCFAPGSYNRIDFSDGASLIPYSEVSARLSNVQATPFKLDQDDINQIALYKSYAESNLQNLKDEVTKIATEYKKALVLAKDYKNSGNSSSKEKFNDQLIVANNKLRAYSGLKGNAFADLDKLMLLSQNISEAQAMCSVKYKAQQELSALQRQAAAIGQAGLKLERDVIDKQIALLDNLLSIVDAAKATFDGLINIVKGSFGGLASAASAITKMFAFFKAHPYAAYGALGVVGIAGIAFVFRPYMSILSSFRK